VSASTKYSYQLTAFDAAGNLSGSSNTATVTTPAPPTKDTQAPTAPANLSAEALNTSQINLAWSPSTDNIGVTGYDIYRSAGDAAPAKIATTLTTSFGDSGLTAATKYTYYVIARDAAGNNSPKSTAVDATTATPPPKPPVATGDIEGKVTNRKTSQPIVGARITLRVDNVRRLITTNQQGDYEVNDIPAGFYAVRYSAANYYSHIQTVKVKGDKVKTVDVTLRPRR
jgi:chitodextrinase